MAGSVAALLTFPKVNLSGLATRALGYALVVAAAALVAGGMTFVLMLLEGSLGVAVDGIDFAVRLLLALLAIALMPGQRFVMFRITAPDGRDLAILGPCAR